ncbi:uncharacterized protein LOC111616485 [Centruroides sculpturatus]|uniref:uncharacterized protein LOC111616485 n=1 Tax=Centruroides sculpturatus TaxID=218467 RepID=UPI000C6EDD19|nr:uncharacterized protein LOC111616485 [Centruroides sculpturatus]XP_023213666.1 uncharacterized protein LOC111616485 [Centruroides sculpturatus]
MKHPRLPGAEKFKFSNTDEDDQHDSAAVSFVRGGQFRNSCPPSIRPGNFSRTEPKRRPVIPITSKTSRVLCNTGLELSSLDRSSLIDNISPVTYRQDNLIREATVPRCNSGRISWPLFGSFRSRGNRRPPSDDYTPTDSPRSSTCLNECVVVDQVDLLSSNDSIQEYEWSSHSSMEEAVWIPRKRNN